MKTLHKRVLAAGLAVGMVMSAGMAMAGQHETRKCQKALKMKKSGCPYMKQQQAKFSSVKTLKNTPYFVGADIDQDGEISFVEAQAAFMTKFGERDIDKNGALSPEEIHASFSKHVQQVREKRQTYCPMVSAEVSTNTEVTKQHFEEGDTDSNGTLSTEEVQVLEEKPSGMHPSLRAHRMR